MSRKYIVKPYGLGCMLKRPSWAKQVQRWCIRRLNIVEACILLHACLGVICTLVRVGSHNVLSVVSAQPKTRNHMMP